MNQDSTVVRLPYGADKKETKKEHINHFILLRGWVPIHQGQVGRMFVRRLKKQLKVSIIHDERFKKFNDIHCLINWKNDNWIASGVILGKYSQGMINEGATEISPIGNKAFHAYGLTCWKDNVALFNCNERACIYRTDGTTHEKVFESKFYFKSRQSINATQPQMLKPRVSKGYCRYRSHVYWISRQGPVVYWNLDKTRSDGDEVVAVNNTHAGDIACNQKGLYVKQIDGTVYRYGQKSEPVWHVLNRFQQKHPILEGKETGETRNNIVLFSSGNVMTEYYSTNVKFSLVLLNERLVKLDRREVENNGLQATHMAPIKIKSNDYCVIVYTKHRFDLVLASKRLHMVVSHITSTPQDNKLHYGVWAKESEVIIYGIGSYIHYSLKY